MPEDAKDTFTNHARSSEKIRHASQKAGSNWNTEENDAAPSDEECRRQIWTLACKLSAVLIPRLGYH